MHLFAKRWMRRTLRKVRLFGLKLHICFPFLLTVSLYGQARSGDRVCKPPEGFYRRTPKHGGHGLIFFIRLIILSYYTQFLELFMDWKDYHPLHIVYNFMDNLEVRYPSTCTVIVIGKSVEGRDIKVHPLLFLHKT